MLVKSQSKSTKYNILLAFPVIIFLAIFVVTASIFIVRSVSENTELLVKTQIPELKAIAEPQAILNRKSIPYRYTYPMYTLPIFIAFYNRKHN